MKKGYVLLESIIALALTITISAAFAPAFLKFMSSSRAAEEGNKDHFYITEALMFIEGEIENAKNPVIYNNIIRLEAENGEIKNYILLGKDDSIFYTYTRNGVILTSNKIIAKVKDFKVFIKGNAAYISITLMNGEALERCVRLNLEE